MRRSTLDVRLGRALAITQEWEDTATGLVWHVRQVHRADCHVELEHSGARRCIPFADLRHDYQQVLERLPLEAAA